MRCLVIKPFTSLRHFAPRPHVPHVNALCRRGLRALGAAAQEGEGASDAPELAPGLYLVGTPIGNLEDITLRALHVLRSADRILCEDTRVTAKLLNHFGIRTPLESYHQHNERSKEARVLALLRADAAVALVSDAGMPAINDPGAQLVAAAAAAGLPVVPIPGPSAVLTALVGSGLPTERFTFCGYTPPKGAARRSLFAELRDATATLVFFASPHALLGSLEDAAAVFGPDRRCCVARELTKLHEEFWRGTLAGALEEFSARGPRGEMTLVVEGAPPGGAGGGEVSDEEILAALRRAVVGEGLAPSQAAREVAARLGAARKRVYALSLTLGREEAEGGE